jgi:Ca2+-binding EF-hand superfamily protein
MCALHALQAAVNGAAALVGAQASVDDESRQVSRGERFSVLDRDRDGFLAADEWSESRDSFVRLDRNGDGAVSRDEYVEPRALTREEWFKQLDQDRDGRLAVAEWRWSRESFDQLDLDHDGDVSRLEFLSRGRDRRGEWVPDRLRSLDRDGDGRVSRSEWSGSRFSRIDRDGDGFLSMEELLGS